MIEPNPHRQTARLFAFGFYILAGVVIVIGIFFTIASAWMDLSQVGMEGVTNRQMVFMSVSLFLIIAVMIGLLGWRVQGLFGQPRRQDKLAAKSAVGCLRLGSLGCGLWGLLAASMTAITGKLLSTGEPAGIREIFIGSSGFILVIVTMLAVAWFISANYVPLKPKERRRAYEAYQEDIKSRLLQLTEPEMQAYAQEQTMEVLAKLDAPLKSALLSFLSESGLLAGPKRIALRGADFRRIDLRSISLPHADLREVNLEQATLQGAFLFEVNLSKASLKKIDLTRANLEGANLRQADLTGAILEKTNLSGADLTEANVALGQLKQAHLETTVLPDGKMSD